jgi:hypothetical protein
LYVENGFMAKKKVEEKKVVERWRGRWDYPEDFPEEYFDLLNERYDTTEKWEEKRREQGLPFNEQFCIDVYFIAEKMTRENSFKGKFNPGEIYEELCETMNTLKKGKKEYSVFDEVKVVGAVMDNHRKKQ